MSQVFARYYPAPDTARSTKTSVFSLRGCIVFTDSHRCYTYDDLNDTIVPYRWLNDNLGRSAMMHGALVHMARKSRDA